MRTFLKLHWYPSWRATAS